MTESYVKAYCLYKDVRIIVDLWVLFLPALFLFLAWMFFLWSWYQDDMARNLGTLLMNWKVITMAGLTGVAAVETALPA